jgi:hypothetical protein
MAACSASKPSSAFVREGACSQRSCSRASGREPDAEVVRLGMSCPPLSPRLRKRPNSSLQARAVPGSNPVASGSLTGLDCVTLVILLRQHLSRNEQFGGGPTDDSCTLGPRCQLQQPSAQLHATSRCSRLLHAKRTACREQLVCALAPRVGHLVCRLAPSTCSRLALFCRSVPFLSWTPSRTR